MSTAVAVEIDQYAINVAKGLIMDTVRNADSGHTGGPLSSLDFTYILYKEFLKFDPDDPNWKDRDRFVLSAGHESALLYTMLTYIGWLEIDDLKQFRQLGSRTPGHPERHLTPGVEATTGPLGQGVGNAVGMAVAECILQQQFGEDVVNHYTYCLHGDGDIQEPVAQGAIAIAGHWGLNKLIHFYDANNAQISGKVTRSDSTDYRKLYEAHGWHVQEIDGHDHDAIRDAIRQAQMEIEKPSVIIGHTIMAQGCATMEDDHNTHGAPLPPDEIASTKEKLELDPALFFNLPEEVLTEFRSGFTYARSEVEAWKSALSSRLEDESFSKNWNLAFGDDFLQVPIPQYEAGTKVATRKVWGPFIEKLAELHPTITGGSADLEPSNVTTGFANLVGDFNKENRRGRNFAYGVREFPMGAVNNGIALHGGLEVFGATFFVFSDYERPAIRLRALQGLPVVSEYTHDSIFVGEDGPTHQPVEHLMACRTIPNLLVLRPADANEAIVACQLAFEQKNRPALVLLTRQGIPVFDRNIYPSPEELKKGGYIMQDCEGNPEVVIFATGSEVWVALEAASKLSVKWKVRVVNIPCWELFDEQPEDYRISVLGPDSALKVSLEAGITLGWEHYTGIGGLNIGIDSFGESAPGGEVARHFGLTAESVVNKIQKHINS
ncbi:MAG: transketolase [Candidatus Marinimicrobia bacterium]|nr:transketolase [Candidatus Neomarinimicrobiota bacterium]